MLPNGPCLVLPVEATKAADESELTGVSAGAPSFSSAVESTRPAFAPARRNSELWVGAAYGCAAADERLAAFAPGGGKGGRGLSGGSAAALSGTVVAAGNEGAVCFFAGLPEVESLSGWAPTAGRALPSGRSVNLPSSSLDIY